MRKLPNNQIVFNSTPHPITFWMKGWQDVIVVAPDELINAAVEEELYGTSNEAGAIHGFGNADFDCHFVTTEFVGNDEGRAVIERAKAQGATLIVGSIIAAQAYPGDVIAMTPAPGYERAAPAEKRMNPNKFTIFPKQ